MTTENTAENAELLRLEYQAKSIDAELDGNETAADPAPGIETAADFNAELADVLDMVALAGSALLPTVPQHFNHAQNERIAGAMILLADKYDYDLRANFLSQDSVVMLWLGLAITVGVPARACVMDWKAAKEKEVKEAAADHGEVKTAKPGAPDPGGDDRARVVTSGG